MFFTSQGIYVDDDFIDKLYKDDWNFIVQLRKQYKTLFKQSGYLYDFNNYNMGSYIQNIIKDENYDLMIADVFNSRAAEAAYN